MKKLILVVLSAVLIFSLVTCGTNRSAEEAGSSTPLPGSLAGSSSTEGEGELPSNRPDSGKFLVVYDSATNHTETVAECIAFALNADLFELVPVIPYTGDDLDWTNSDSRVSREYRDALPRNVELERSVPDHWEEYDTVFIGYPIWWGIASWAMDGFVSANDFAGKTVIPFCTSASSGLGQSGQLLADAAGTGNWLEGHRFSSGASAQSVREWLQTLGF